MNPNSDADLTQLLLRAMPFTELLGMEAIAASPEEVILQGAWAPQRCTASGVVHGGYLMAMADAAGATLASLNLPEGASTSTIESKTNFIRPVTAGSITVTASLVHCGRTTIVVQTDTHRDDGRLVTRTTQTQAILGTS